MVKVLFVCLGNICRSPVAEAIFNNQIKESQLEQQFWADSAGTASYHIGESPDNRSVSNALNNNIEVQHRARQFTSHDFDLFDYILAMDRNNLRHVKDMAEECNNSHHGIFLFRSFQETGNELDVPDPYFGGNQGFQQVFDILQDSNQQFIKYLLDNHK